MTEPASDRPEDASDERSGATRTGGLVAIVGLDGTVERLSQAWEVELGRSRAALVGGPFFELLHRPDLEQLRPQAGEDASVVARFDARLPRFDGSLRLYRWSARVVEGRIGAVPGRQALYVRGEPVDGEELSLAEALTSRVLGILSPPRGMAPGG